MSDLEGRPAATAAPFSSASGRRFPNSGHAQTGYKWRRVEPLILLRDRQEKVAAQHHLQVVDGKIPLPDLRIEYRTANGDTARVDLELTTKHYKARQIAAKARGNCSESTVTTMLAKHTGHGIFTPEEVTSMPDRSPDALKHMERNFTDMKRGFAER